MDTRFREYDELRESMKRNDNANYYVAESLRRASGIMQFEAEVLPKNEGMLSLFSRSGTLISKSTTRDSVYREMELSKQEKR